MRLIQVDSVNKTLRVFDNRVQVAAYTFDHYPEQEQIDLLLAMDFAELNDPYTSFDWTI